MTFEQLFWLVVILAVAAALIIGLGEPFLAATAKRQAYKLLADPHPSAGALRQVIGDLSRFAKKDVEAKRLGDDLNEKLRRVRGDWIPGGQP